MKFAGLKRISFDSSILLFIVIVLFLLPIQFQRQGVELILFKACQYYAGVLAGHFTRKLLFPYIDFKTEKDPFKKLMIIAVYVMAIFAFCRGG